MTTTFKLQKHNRYNYITEAIATRLKNEPVLSLLPSNEDIKPVKLAA